MDENLSNKELKKKSKKERRGLCLSDSRRAEVTNLKINDDRILNQSITSLLRSQLMEIQRGMKTTDRHSEDDVTYPIP